MTEEPSQNVSSQAGSEPLRSPDADRAGLLSVILVLAALGHLIWSRTVWGTIPLQTDTGIWAYFAGRMLDGAALYRDLWESKPPGIFWTFAVVEWLFGGGDRALLWLDAVVTAAVCILTFCLARRFASRGTAMWLVCLLSVLLNHRILADWGDNLEKFVAFFELAALLLLVRGPASGVSSHSIPTAKDGEHRDVGKPDMPMATGRFVVAGMCCGVAFHFKQTAVLLFLLLLIAIVCGVRGIAIDRRADRKRGAAFFLAGALVPWIATTFWLGLHGSLDAFVRQVLLHDLHRASGVEAERSQLANPEHWANVGRHLMFGLAIFGPALAACLAIVLNRGKPRGDSEGSVAAAPAGPALIAAYAVSVTLIFVFAPNGYGHYLLQSLPAATVLVAWLCDAGPMPSVRVAKAVGLVAFVVGALQLNEHFKFLSDSNSDARKAYAVMSRYTREMTQVLETRTTSDQSVMLWPSDHTISYYADRRTPLEMCQAIDIFRGRIYLLDPPMPEIIRRLQADPPDVIVDWTPVGVGPPSEQSNGQPELLVPAGGFSLAEDPNPDHQYAEGRELAPLKAWIRMNYGGQQRVGNLCTVYHRGRPWRDWREYMARTEPILAN
ncbi:MAG: hypothetical protein HS101_15405 [Planctomycetia bacterium]|nr:hypothetical protein [Planctomycetia bacterium]MCC7316860.1 hypothetical protein [Planctomycetota bacterium]